MNQSFCAGRPSRFFDVAGLKSLSRLILIIGLVTAAAPVRAQTRTADDQYLDILTVVDRADSLNEKKQGDLGKAKYAQAARDLQQLRMRYPTWNPKMVAFRLGYVTDKVNVLTQTNPAPAAVTGSPEAASAGAGKQIKLVAAGAEPRQALRFQVAAGDQQVVTTTVKSIREVAGNALPEPEKKLTVTVTVKNLAANGDITYDSLVDDIALDGANANPAMMAAIESMMEKLKGLSFTTVATSRGVGRSATANTAGMDAQTKAIVESLKESVAQGTTSLPEEPVGVGAKWELKRSASLQGIKATETVTWELVSVDGETVRLKTVSMQNAAAQKIDNPMMPGSKLDVTKLAGNGSGTITLNLKKLMPLASNSTQNSELSASMSLGGQKQTFVMKSVDTITSEAK